MQNYLINFILNEFYYFHFETIHFRYINIFLYPIECKLNPNLPQKKRKKETIEIECHKKSTSFFESTQNERRKEKSKQQNYSKRKGSISVETGRVFPGRVPSRLNRPSVTRSLPAFRGFEMQSSRSPDSEREARPGWKRHLVRSKVVSSVNLRFSSPPPLAERNFLRPIFLPRISYFASSPFPYPRLLNFPSDVISRANRLV